MRVLLPRVASFPPLPFTALQYDAVFSVSPTAGSLYTRPNQYSSENHEAPFFGASTAYRSCAFSAFSFSLAMARSARERK